MFNRLPLILFVAALALSVFFAGMWVWESRVFPYHLARSAHKTLMVALEMRGLIAPEAERAPVAATEVVPGFDPGSLLECDQSEAARELAKKLRKGEFFTRLACPAARVASHEARAKRIEFIAADRLDDPILVGGGGGHFIEHCPPSPRSALPGGCLAVEYSRAGEVRRATPFRPQAIEAANIVSEQDYPFEHPLGWVFAKNALVSSVSSYPGGDLLAVFRVLRAFPYGGGAARVAPDGHPRWFRRDYSHHLPHVIDDNLALVPGFRVERKNRALQVGQLKSALGCGDESWLVDTVLLIDGAGRLLEEIDILGALLDSPYNGIFLPEHQRMRCDPTHLNFAHQLGPDASGAAGLAPGDLVVSLRNLDAFGIIDWDTRRLKRLARGGFVHQHAVRHFEKARFLLFDNLGTDGVHGPSRLLMVDLATGKETTLFPRDHTPARMRWVTHTSGALCRYRRTGDAFSSMKRMARADLGGASFRWPGFEHFSPVA